MHCASDHPSMHACMHAGIQSYTHAYIHTAIHACIHASNRCTDTQMQRYIDAYVHESRCVSESWIFCRLSRLAPLLVVLSATYFCPFTEFASLVPTVWCTTHSQLAQVLEQGPLRGCREPSASCIGRISKAQRLGENLGMLSTKQQSKEAREKRMDH